MTKEITKAFILQQMTDKLKLREMAPEKFTFSELVMPIYDIEQHLEEWWNQYANATITGTGPFAIVCVPADEKWTLKRYDSIFMTGAYTIAGIYIHRKNRNPSGATVYLDLKAAQNTSYHIETDVVLTPGDALYVNVDGYTATGTFRLYFDYKKEIIR